MQCQGTRDNEPMFRHLSNCPQFTDICRMLANDVNVGMSVNFNVKDYIYNAVLNNSRILKRFNNSVQLAFLEAYYIKLNSPSINVGIAASKELVLFK